MPADLEDERRRIDLKIARADGINAQISLITPDSTDLRHGIPNLGWICVLCGGQLPNSARFVGKSKSTKLKALCKDCKCVVTECPRLRSVDPTDGLTRKVCDPDLWKRVRPKAYRGPCPKKDVIEAAARMRARKRMERESQQKHREASMEEEESESGSEEDEEMSIKEPQNNRALFTEEALAARWAHNDNNKDEESVSNEIRRSQRKKPVNRKLTNFIVQSSSESESSPPSRAQAANNKYIPIPPHLDPRSITSNKPKNHHPPTEETFTSSSTSNVFHKPIRPKSDIFGQQRKHPSNQSSFSHSQSHDFAARQRDFPDQSPQRRRYGHEGQAADSMANERYGEGSSSHEYDEGVLFRRDRKGNNRGGDDKSGRRVDYRGNDYNRGYEARENQMGYQKQNLRRGGMKAKSESERSNKATYIRLLGLGIAVSAIFLGWLLVKRLSA